MLKPLSNGVIPAKPIHQHEYYFSYPRI
jgi:hypothetical protein